MFVTPRSSERILTDIMICRLYDTVVEKGLNTRRSPGGGKALNYFINNKIYIRLIILYQSKINFLVKAF